MEIIEKWKGMTNFGTWHPEVLEKVKSFLLNLAPCNRCYIEEIDDDWIRLVFVDEGIEGILEYTTSELHELTEDDLVEDIKNMRRFLQRGELKLLQIVFDEFKRSGIWPNSREMSLKAREAGLRYYYSAANDIGVDYIRVGEERVAEDTSRLTVRAIHLCEGSKDELNSFLQLLKIFIERYNESPRNPIVNLEDLVKQGIFSPPQCEKVSLMIVEEGRLWTSASRYNGKSSNITVAPSILEFDSVRTIRDYLRVQDSFLKDGVSISTQTTTIEGGQTKEFINEARMKYDLFISYSSKDQEVADEIYEKLVEADLKPFLAPKDIDSGYIGSVTIREALKSSAEMAILMSPNSIKSEWVLTEWGAAWGFEKHVTPILLDCQIGDIPKLLQDRQKRDYPNEIDRYIKEVLKRKHEP